MREGRLSRSLWGPWSFSCPCRNLRPTSIRTRVSLFLARCTLRSSCRSALPSTYRSSVELTEYPVAVAVNAAFRQVLTLLESLVLDSLRCLATFLLRMKWIVNLAVYP